MSGFLHGSPKPMQIGKSRILKILFSVRSDFYFFFIFSILYPKHPGKRLRIKESLHNSIRNAKLLLFSSVETPRKFIIAVINLR